MERIDFPVIKMAEFTNGNTNNTIEIDKYSNPSEFNEKVKSIPKPSGIPRLFTATSAKHSSDSLTGQGSIEAKIQVFTNKVTSNRPTFIVNDSKTSCQENDSKCSVMSPTYSKLSSRDALSFGSSINTDHRPRNTVQPINRHDRAASEGNQGRKSLETSYSEPTNNYGSTGCSNYVITSKIGSLSNARYKPGGGNVTIIENKIDFSNVESRCGSKKNIKYKPGGGDFEIISRKLEFSKTAEPKVNSLKNIKHTPKGGDVKIDNRKLEWNTNSKIGSLNNVKHKPGGGSVQIVNQQLPWLKYNKPNLPLEEISKIEKRTYADYSKQTIGTPPQSYSNSQCSDHSR